MRNLLKRKHFYTGNFRLSRLYQIVIETVDLALQLKDLDTFSIYYVPCQITLEGIFYLKLHCFSLLS